MKYVSSRLGAALSYIPGQNMLSLFATIYDSNGVDAVGRFINSRCHH